MLESITKNRKLILLYHRIGNGNLGESYSSPRRSLPVNRFESQISWLSEFADFVTLRELFSANPKNKWKVSITFDDGYKNNISKGLPVFEKYNVPITWFISTKFVKKRNILPWWDLVDLIRDKINGRVDVWGKKYDLGSSEGEREFHHHIRGYFLNMGRGRRESLREVLESIYQEYETLPLNAFASPESVIDASKSRWITVGGHTVSHINMGSEPPERIAKEVQEGRKTLQEWTGQSVEWFAYPYGGDQHWDEAAQRIVSRSGFEGAVTTKRGYVNENVHRYSIHRFNVPPPWSMSKFKTAVLALGAVDRAIKVKDALFG